MSMTVIHVEAGKHLYGGALQVFYLLRGLSEKPMRNVLVCPEGSAIAKTTHEVVDAVYEVPMKGDLDIVFIARLKKIIKQENADIVHLHSRRGADLLGGIAAKLAGVKSVLSRRVDNPEAAWAVSLKYKLYDRVITISNGIRDVLLSEGVPADKVICVHSAVDVAKFDRRQERDWFLNEFNLQPDNKILAVVAQLIYRKGHRHLFAALPDVIKQHPEVRVLLFGKGPLEKELQEQIAAQGLQEHVRLIGFRDDLERILPSLYALVHPADMEGLGVSLLQAAAAGVPIIGAAAGGIPEIVQDKLNGYLVPPQDVAALRKALFALLADEHQAKQFGLMGKECVQQNFSIQAMVDGNYREYCQLLLV